ncbi:MAG: sulfite exporter TauE/SafE family protein [Planctomycetes bacterium]|nr:sulfite exporter TauE/SafE family protein [Planctomycetota bacterium]
MLIYLWLCLTALAAGMQNAIAGGGTLLTFPALLAVVAPVMANGTSTVALFPGSIASAWGYRKKVAASKRWIILLTIPSILGGASGTLLVTLMPDKVFEDLIPWLVLGAAILFLLQPTIGKSLRRAHQGKPKAWTLAGIIVFQFLVAIYGGYFGAGIGILMLSSLAFLDLADIHEVNALKTWLAFCINCVAAVVFVVQGQVSWPHALAMMVAAIVGGYVGARLALKLKPVYVRWIVIVIGFGLAAYFFWDRYGANPESRR